MQATGIQIDGLLLRRATVKRTRQNLQICSLLCDSINDPCKPDLQTSPPKTLSFRKTKNRRAERSSEPVNTSLSSRTLVSGLHSNDLIVRSRTFAPARSRKLRQALILQVEAQLHLKAEELITVSQFETQEKRATTYSTTHSALNEHLEAFHRLNLNPERVSAVPAALKAFVQWKKPEIPSYFVLDIGLNATNCIWVENGLLQKSHAISSGLQQLKNSFLEERKKNSSLKEDAQIDFAAIKTGQYLLFAEEARAYRREILKLLHSFQCQRPLIFTGETDDQFFLEFLLETFRECITEETKIGCEAEETRYAICIGLAVDYLINSRQPIQFRTGNRISSQNWHKLGTRSVGLFATAAMLCTLIYGTGSWWMNKREYEVVQNLETWTAAKDPSLRLELFSAGAETEALVSQWIKLIEKNSKDYRFLMKAPKVARFLNWLTHHPIVESFRLSSDPLFFEQIHYQLTSFPHLDAMEDPYLVKVELDFKVSSPLHARKFHEMLLQGNDLIDSSREVGWDVLADRYKASFYLKNE